MNQQKLDDIVSHIDYLMSELKHLRSKLTIEDGIHFNIIDEENLFAIEQWDSEVLEPRVLAYFPDRLKIEDAIKHATKALNTLGIRAYKKQIYWNSDIEWKHLPENFRKLDMVYNVEKRDLSDTLRNEMKERLNALYCLPEQQ